MEIVAVANTELVLYAVHILPHNDRMLEQVVVFGARLMLGHEHGAPVVD